MSAGSRHGHAPGSLRLVAASQGLPRQDGPAPEQQQAMLDEIDTALARRTCDALGLCQAREPACPDCPAQPAPSPKAAAPGPWPDASAGPRHAALLDPDADAGLGPLIAAVALCIVSISLFAIIGAGVTAGILWQLLAGGAP